MKNFLFIIFRREKFEHALLLLGSKLSINMFKILQQFFSLSSVVSYFAFSVSIKMVESDFVYSK